MSTNEALTPRWAAFLDALDSGLHGEAVLHCLGGFAVTVCYGLARVTKDFDVIAVIPDTRLRDLLALAGRGTAMARQHRTFVDFVTVATVPDNYEERIRPVLEGRFQRLELFALDPYVVQGGEGTARGRREARVPAI